MADFAINGNNALQATQGNEKLYKKVVVDGQTQYVEVPIGKPETKTNLTKSADLELHPFEQTVQKEIQQTREFLDSSDKKTRKGAEETMKDLYQQAFMAQGKSEKEAKKLAKLALKEEQAALRFENRKVFIDKDEYKKARAADKCSVSIARAFFVPITTQ